MKEKDSQIETYQQKQEASTFTVSMCSVDRVLNYVYIDSILNYVFIFIFIILLYFLVCIDVLIP